MEFQKKIAPYSSSFEAVRTYLESENLTVKEYKAYPTLYLVFYTHGDNETSAKWPECRGLIVEKDTGRIVCHTLGHIPRALERLTELVASEAIDGIQLKLFYYGDKWNVATTRCIDIAYSKWNGTSFAKPYAVVAPQIDFARLDKTCCYALVMQHPECRIVERVAEPKLYHIMTRSLTTMEEVRGDDIGLPRPAGASANCIIMTDAAGRRSKYVSPEYQRIKDLKGNQYDTFYRYIELWKADQLGLYLAEFPEQAPAFAEYAQRIASLCIKLHRLYLESFVRKTGKFVEKPIYKYLWQIHATYQAERTPRTRERICEFVQSLHASQTYFLAKRCIALLSPFGASRAPPLDP